MTARVTDVPQPPDQRAEPGTVVDWRYPVTMAFPAALPEPRDLSAAASSGGVEPDPAWTGDSVAARRFPTPASIRAVLPTQQLAQFDAAYQHALTTAGDTYNLDALRNVMLVWRREALKSHQDPRTHQQMLAAVDEIQRTGKPRTGTMTWTELRGELGV
jgi:hypothetical protein